MKFELGQIVCSIGIQQAMHSSPSFLVDVQNSLHMYEQGYWGALSEADRQANEESLIANDELLGCYHTCRGDICILTEWNHKVTTIFFPDEK